MLVKLLLNNRVDIFTSENNMAYLNSHVKRSPSLYLHNKSHLYSKKKKKKKKKLAKLHGVVFHWCLEIEHYMVAGTYEISFLELKNITNIIQPSKRDFVSPRGRREIFGRPNLSDK